MRVAEEGAGLVVAESNQGGEMVKEELDVASEGAVRVKHGACVEGQARSRRAGVGKM